MTRSDMHVAAWSKTRLPFEPKGWLLDYRSELQSALRSMKPSPGSILYAEYATPDDQFADLENILLYNIGTGCYAHLAHQGIVCRRVRSPDQLHHVSYTSSESPVFAAPSGELLATAVLNELPQGSTATHWWAAFRGQLDDRVEMLHEGEFGVSVEVGTAWRRPLAPAVKPLLDGLIAALHVHNGSARDLVTAAFNDVGTGDRLWRLLNDPGAAILGERRLVRPHGQKIAWNPADERCGYFKLTRSQTPGVLAATVLAL